MALHPDFLAILPTILDVLGKGNVRSAYVFGSACTDRFRETSDIDLFVEIDDSDVDRYVKEWWRIYFELEDRTDRSIDLLTQNNLGNRFFRQEVMETRERLV